jgi:hypothetical protein
MIYYNIILPIMTTLMSFIVFIFVLFLYVHITAHYKKSEDLEIYEADYTSNKELQEICDLRQPVLFDIGGSSELRGSLDETRFAGGRSPNANNSFVPNLEQYDLETIRRKSEKSSYDIHIKDIKDIQTNPEIGGDSILLPFNSGYGLIETDKKSRFFSENNTEFANEILDHSIDDILKPGFTAQTKYDIIFGSDKSYTACRYHSEYRKFLLVKNGKIQVKMTPWKSRKYLFTENDYVNYEFRSPIDIWNPQPQYSKEYEKIKFLEFEIMEGFVLYLPPFWFYSIKFINNNEGAAMVESYTYNSIMNIAANTPQICMYFLQQFNIQTKVLPKKTLHLEESDEEPNEPKKANLDESSDFTI